MSTQIERLARLEERVSVLEDKVDSMNDKLDQLLTLKYKGAGAFWLMSILFGSGIAAVILRFFGGNH